MNILRGAWDKVRYRPTQGVAVVMRLWSAYLVDRGKCRAIADLEALPRSVLRDMGIRRGEIPLVVEKAAQEQSRRIASETEKGSGPASATVLADSDDSVSPSPVPSVYQ